MSNTKRFTDHGQQAAHAAKSATFILDLDALDIYTHDESGELVSFISDYAHDCVESPESLLNFIRFWNGVGFSPRVANEMMAAVYKEYADELPEEDPHAALS